MKKLKKSTNNSLKNFASSLGLIVLLSGVIALSSCAKFQFETELPNPEGCSELVSGDAFCKRVITGEERSINSGIWRFERVGRVSFTPQDTAQILSFMERVCQEAKCSSEEMAFVKEKVDAFNTMQENVRLWNAN